MTTAKTYYVDSGTYTGLDPATAGTIEPNLSWKGNEPASPDAVSIDLAEGPLVVISTLSGSGQAFCIADDSLAVTYGRRDAVDAQSIADCDAANTTGW